MKAALPAGGEVRALGRRAGVRSVGAHRSLGRSLVVWARWQGCCHYCPLLRRSERRWEGLDLFSDHSDQKKRTFFFTRWERSCLFEAAVVEASVEAVEVAASTAAAVATTTSEVEAVAVSEAAAEEGLEEGAAAEGLTKARIKDPRNA